LAQALLCFLLRKVDRAGVMDLGGNEPARAVAAVVRMPLDVVERTLPELTKAGVFEIGATAMVMPNYIEAQEAKSSDKQRQSESRGRRRDRARAGADVTQRDTSSHPVTRGHDVSHDVTPSLAKPSQSTLSSAVLTPDEPAKPKQPTDVDRVWQRLNDLRKAIMPKARFLKLSAKQRKAITERIAESSFEDAIDVLEHLAEKCRRNPAQLQWFNGVTPFRPDNYARTLGQLGTSDARGCPEIDLEGFDPMEARRQLDAITGPL